MTQEEAKEIVCRITDGGVQFLPDVEFEGSRVMCSSNDLAELLGWAAMHPIVACDVASGIRE